MTDLDLNADAGRELHDLMERSLTDLPTPVDRLRSGSLRRGRVVRRRRRAGAALGGLAALAAVTAIALPSLTGSRASEGSIATEPPSSAPGYTEPPPGRWDMPGRVMLTRLQDLLPAGITTADANLGNEELAPGEEPHGGWLQVDLLDADGDRVGGLNVLLYPPYDASDAEIAQRNTCGDDVDPDAGTCTVQHDAAGEPVGRTFRSPSDDGVVVTREVTIVGPEGAQLYAAASNSSDEKWGVGSSTDTTAPALTVAQLRDLISDPTWLDWTPSAG
jgi:hypothetical protein